MPFTTVASTVPLIPGNIYTFCGVDYVVGPIWAPSAVTPAKKKGGRCTTWVGASSSYGMAELEKAIEAMKDLKIPDGMFVTDDAVDAVKRISEALPARKIKPTKDNAEKLMHALDLAATHLQLFIDTNSDLEWESVSKVLQAALKELTIDKA